METIDNNIEVLITQDGSSSLRRKDLQEGYHSTYGAIAESVHIFIDAGLRNVEKHSLINILEIGFGTGLNALLTCEFAIKEKQSIYYQTIEKYPLSQQIISQLNYGKLLSLEEEFLKIHSVSWNENAEINNLFSIHKIDKPAENLNYKANFFDIIYFDAFAPQFEENLWQQEMFAKLYSSLKEGGLLVTYCCKGDVKRALKASGFQIEKLPGPKGKREILRAKKI
ncbi:MAG: tRNA (5-methylaminomethyl-2-thiouridine)(34)-methyltransferase MnmD [Bacteroidales bacterium]|nr:tRNA (5-methylaminomethyl-2-thiouridine)(34)-methyltransferase MnmD [Bacteroidales bacterium]